MSATVATMSRALTVAGESPVSFPLNSFREAAIHLRRPFTAAAVKFKVQATWPKENPTGGLIVAYIDARLAIERLNLIVPHLWYDEYEPLGRNHLVCRLTVDGITRQDVGEGVGKGLYSDALKRAAVKFGIGVPLYAVPQLKLGVGRGLEVRRNSQVMMTAEGEREARSRYQTWLTAHGIHSFGDPLDHGDIEESQGDAEIPEPSAAVAPAGVEGETGEIVSEPDIKELLDAAQGLTGAQVKLALSSIGAEPPQPFTRESAFDRVPKSKAARLAAVLSGTERQS